MSTVELRGVHKAYGRMAKVIRNVNITLSQGELCVFVGPSGCGKSTLLRMVAGLEEITEGELLIDGVCMNNVPSDRRGIAMVFQSYALFPHMTVYENIAFGMKLAKTPIEQIKSRVNEAARILQLEPLLDRKPKALSGGQRQRVAIGRAIVRQPGVFLFDEPLSNLDAALRVQTRVEIARIHRDFGKASTIYVTHDQVEALTLADRILLLNSEDNVDKYGSVAQIGKPLDLYHRPQNKFVAGFIGSPKMNFFPATVVSAEADHLMAQLSTGEMLRACVNGAGQHKGGAITLGIRPEHVGLGNQTQHLIRPVQWQERLGESTYVFLDSGDIEEPWVAKSDGVAVVDAGQRVAFCLPEQDLHVFDSNHQALPRLQIQADQPVPVAA